MMNDLLNLLRTNARLRIGLAVILGIGWLYGVLMLRDEVDTLHQRYRSSAQTLGRLEAQLAEPQWVARASAARAMAVQLEGKLWQAPTPGLAQAALQDWLTQAMVKAGVGNPQITVAAVEESSQSNAASDPASASNTDEMSDLWKIKARMSFDFNPVSLMDYLAALETYEHQSTVRILTVRKEPSPRVELETLSYFQKQKTVDVRTPSQAKPQGGSLP